MKINLSTPAPAPKPSYPYVGTNGDNVVAVLGPNFAFNVAKVGAAGDVTVTLRSVRNVVPVSEAGVTPLPVGAKLTITNE